MMYLFCGDGVVVVSEGFLVPVGFEFSKGVLFTVGFWVPGVLIVVFLEGEPGHELTIMKVPTKNITICNSHIFCSIEGNE